MDKTKGDAIAINADTDLVISTFLGRRINLSVTHRVDSQRLLPRQHFPYDREAPSLYRCELPNPSHASHTVRAQGSNNREVGAARAKAEARAGEGGCLHT